MATKFDKNRFMSERQNGGSGFNRDRFVDAYAGLEDSRNKRNKAFEYKESELQKVKDEQDLQTHRGAMNPADNALAGSAAGSAFGPWGMLAGAAIGHVQGVVEGSQSLSERGVSDGDVALNSALRMVSPVYNDPSTGKTEFAFPDLKDPATMKNAQALGTTAMNNIGEEDAPEMPTNASGGAGYGEWNTEQSGPAGQWKGSFTNDADATGNSSLYDSSILDSMQSRNTQSVNQGAPGQPSELALEPLPADPFASVEQGQGVDAAIGKGQKLAEERYGESEMGRGAEDYKLRGVADDSRAMAENDRAMLDVINARNQAAPGVEMAPALNMGQGLAAMGAEEQGLEQGRVQNKIGAFAQQAMGERQAQIGNVDQKVEEVVIAIDNLKTATAGFEAEEAGIYEQRLAEIEHEVMGLQALEAEEQAWELEKIHRDLQEIAQTVQIAGIRQ